MSTYPGGKSGAGVFQRLINLIPRHRILIVPFAGHCGIVRNIIPAEQTIVVDACERVCSWWNDWQTTKHGRRVEIHCCDGIEFLRHRFGLTRYRAAKSSDVRSQAAETNGTAGSDAFSSGTAGPQDSASEYFVFCDPPYLLSLRASGKQYENEMTDMDHVRLLEVLTHIPESAAAIMLCGYSSELYSKLIQWRTIDHQVPTRGGLQWERLWLNYSESSELHDWRYLGTNRRERERIWRRQRNWSAAIQRMRPEERRAMLSSLQELET